MNQAIPKHDPTVAGEQLLAFTATTSMLGRAAARIGDVDQSATTLFALTELEDGGAKRLGALERRLGLSQLASSALVSRG